MGPCVDVYVRLPTTAPEVVRSFLDAYAPHWREPEAWATVEALDDLRRGLARQPPRDPDNPNLYLTSKRWPLADGLDYVIVSFDPDLAGTVLGISLPDNGIADNDEATRRLAVLQALVGAADGFWASECPPPKSEEEWRSAVGDFEERSRG